MHQKFDNLLSEISNFHTFTLASEGNIDCFRQLNLAGDLRQLLKLKCKTSHELIGALQDVCLVSNFRDMLILELYTSGKYSWHLAINQMYFELIVFR
jgi:hypothetical protein